MGSPKNEQKQDSDLSSNEIAFQNLVHEINDDLVVHEKVFRMTQLLEKYKAYLHADTGTYSSAKLQDRLVKHYAGSIVIHTQRGQGMSNIVFTIQHALHQLVHTLTGCNCMYFKIFLECFILTNETKIPLNGFVMGACYNTYL
jgi:hypothetical protein